MAAPGVHDGHAKRPKMRGRAENLISPDTTPDAEAHSHFSSTPGSKVFRTRGPLLSRTMAMLWRRQMEY